MQVNIVTYPIVIKITWWSNGFTCLVQIHLEWQHLQVPCSAQRMLDIIGKNKPKKHVMHPWIELDRPKIVCAIGGSNTIYVRKDGGNKFLLIRVIIIFLLNYIVLISWKSSMMLVWYLEALNFYWNILFKKGLLYKLMLSVLSKNIYCLTAFVRLSMFIFDCK